MESLEADLARQKIPENVQQAACLAFASEYTLSFIEEQAASTLGGQQTIAQEVADRFDAAVVIETAKNPDRVISPSDYMAISQRLYAEVKAERKAVRDARNVVKETQPVECHE